MTIGILSWGAHETLKNTLNSYDRYDLPIYDQERIIYFQQITDLDIKIADRFGWKWTGSEENVGIAEGYKRLVELATGTLFLFLENDWELVVPAASALSDSRYLISTNQADYIKLRNRWNPGNPLWTKQFQDNEMVRPSHLLDCVHWQFTPDKLFPEQIKRVDVYNRVWYTTTSKYGNWSNNPHIAKTQWLKDNILPQLKKDDLEVSLQPWWEQQDFKVAQGDGLFTHNRKD